MLLTVPPLISNSETLSVKTRAPMPCSSFCVVLTSRSMGTFFSRSVPAVSSPAHISGRAAFFAPEMVISPFKGPLAEILSLSMDYFRRGREGWAVSRVQPIPQAWRQRKPIGRAVRWKRVFRPNRL